MAPESAETQTQQANRMRPERAVRIAGLALVLLFPLLSLLQLRDTDRPWREAARRTRPAVLALYRQAGSGGTREVATCALVIQAHPARVVVPGSASTTYVSLHGGEQLTWTPVTVDTQGEFTVLEAAGSGTAASRLTPAKLGMDAAGSVPEEVEAVLVAPAALADQPLWVGVLSAAPGAQGRLGYFGDFLTPISGATPLPATEAFAGTAAAIDPALRGAPFVDAAGNIVAVLLDRGPRGVRALPAAVLAQALVLLHLQAAK